MRFELLETERLQLRKMGVEEYQYIFTQGIDDTIKELLNLGSDEELEAEKEKTKKGRWTHNKSFLYFQLIDKLTGNIIGWCGYHTWYLEHSRAEIGYAITNDDYKNKGLMSEALSPIIGYGFEQMNLHRIEAFIGPANLASQKLVQKKGFQKEGVLREHYFKQGVTEDSIVYSLLNTQHRSK
jgi:ribosomal-protein-alanine N-acetyltransferase